MSVEKIPLKTEDKILRQAERILPDLLQLMLENEGAYSNKHVRHAFREQDHQFILALIGYLAHLAEMKGYVYRCDTPIAMHYGWRLTELGKDIAEGKLTSANISHLDSETDEN